MVLKEGDQEFREAEKGEVHSKKGALKTRGDRRAEIRVIELKNYRTQTGGSGNSGSGKGRGALKKTGENTRSTKEIVPLKIERENRNDVPAKEPGQFGNNREKIASCISEKRMI